jgi:hypothetical protein
MLPEPVKVAARQLLQAVAADGVATDPTGQILVPEENTRLIQVQAVQVVAHMVWQEVLEEAVEVLKAVAMVIQAEAVVITEGEVPVAPENQAEVEGRIIRPQLQVLLQ